MDAEPQLKVDIEQLKRLDERSSTYGKQLWQVPLAYVAAVLVAAGQVTGRLAEPSTARGTTAIALLVGSTMLASMYVKEVSAMSFWLQLLGLVAGFIGGIILAIAYGAPSDVHEVAGKPTAALMISGRMWRIGLSLVALGFVLQGAGLISGRWGH